MRARGRSLVIAAMFIVTAWCLCVQSAKAQSVLKIGRKGNLRAGPSTTDHVIGKVSAGMEVTQLAESGSWFKVKLPLGEVGWMHRTLIQDSPPPTDVGSGDMVTGGLDTDGGRFTMRLNGRMVAYWKDTRFARVPSTGQALLRDNKLVTAGRVQELTSDRITLALPDTTAGFLLTDATETCTQGAPARSAQVAVGDLVTVISAPDAVTAIAVCIGQFYVLINRDDPRHMEVQIEDYTCGSDGSTRK